MKTLLTETAAIEQFILGEMTPADAVLFQTRLILDPKLRADYYAQKKIHDIVSLYNQEKIRGRLMDVHQRLFADPSNTFARSILRLFNQ
jgi:hypothetical protein